MMIKISLVIVIMMITMSSIVKNVLSIRKKTFRMTTIMSSSSSSSSSSSKGSNVPNIGRGIDTNYAAKWQAQGQYYVSYDILRKLDEQLISFKANRNNLEKSSGKTVNGHREI